jgi:uncharacterized membrane protein
MHKHADPKTKHLAERFESRLEFESTWSDKLADFLTSSFGTVTFLLLNALFFAGWLLLNTGILPFPPFDPYPFGLLTTIVSLEAIFLSTIVLISQKRQGHIADLRQQMDFEIDVRTEEEISKILDILDQMRGRMGLHHPDAELEVMKQKPDLEAIRREIESEKH